ncbi:MAG: hypothetical protein ABGZ53_13145 [Fuerstiella sp.]
MIVYSGRPKSRTSGADEAKIQFIFPVPTLTIVEHVQPTGRGVDYRDQLVGYVSDDPLSLTTGATFNCGQICSPMCVCGATYRRMELSGIGSTVLSACGTGNAPCALRGVSMLNSGAVGTLGTVALSGASVGRSGGVDFSSSTKGSSRQGANGDAACDGRKGAFLH